MEWARDKFVLFIGEYAVRSHLGVKLLSSQSVELIFCLQDRGELKVSCMSMRILDLTADTLTLRCSTL